MTLPREGGRGLLTDDSAFGSLRDLHELAAHDGDIDSDQESLFAQQPLYYPTQHDSARFGAAPFVCARREGSLLQRQRVHGEEHRRGRAEEVAEALEAQPAGDLDPVGRADLGLGESGLGG